MKQKVWPITLAAARYAPQRGGPARSWGTQSAGRSNGERTTVASRHCFTLSHANPAAKSPPHFISTWTSVPEGFSYSQLKTYRNINRKLYIPIVRSHESNQKHFSPLASKPQQDADSNQGPWVSQSDCYGPTWEDSREEGMVTHSRILAWRIPMDREASWATVCGVAKSQT